MDRVREHHSLFKHTNKPPRLRHHDNHELKVLGEDKRSVGQKALDYVHSVFRKDLPTIYPDNPTEQTTSTPLPSTETSSGMTKPVPERKPVLASGPISRTATKLYDWDKEDEDSK